MRPNPCTRVQAYTPCQRCSYLHRFDSFPRLSPNATKMDLGEGDIVYTERNRAVHLQKLSCNLL